MADVILPDTLRLLEGTKELITLNADTNQRGSVLGGQVICRDTNGAVGAVLNGGAEGEGERPDGGTLFLRNGSVTIADRAGKQRALLIASDDRAQEQGGILALIADGDTASGPPGATGAIVLNAARRSLVIHGKDGRSRVELGAGGNLALGGSGTNGELVLRNTFGRQIGRFGGDATNMILGGEGHDADLLLVDSSGATRIHVDAGRGGDANPTARVYVDGKNGDLSLGGSQVNGELLLKDASGKTRIHADAQGGHIKLMTAGGDLKVHIDGDAGDIILPNADCAEDFDLSELDACEPGSVMVIDGEGLRECDSAFDKKVAGILSGAGELRPGIILGRNRSDKRRRPLALVGKVLCKVDADHAPIEVGDLLTTSSTRGHAMKASDPLKAFGAVIGKALRPLERGRGLIPVLVALQ